ncbi:MAG: hypothetical protein LLG04_09245 [Parachlamydia sp.]|nr:hypothetical protein [Parachlamydia sp.]
MHIDADSLKGAVSSILLVWIFIKQWTDAISSAIKPVIIQVEQMAVDGVITKPERRILAASLLKSFEAQGKIKLNLISRFIVSKLIDRIAQSLPDFTISQEVAKAAVEAVSQIRESGSRNMA